MVTFYILFWVCWKLKYFYSLWFQGNLKMFMLLIQRHWRISFSFVRLLSKNKNLLKILIERLFFKFCLNEKCFIQGIKLFRFLVFIIFLKLKFFAVTLMWVSLQIGIWTLKSLFININISLFFLFNLSSNLLISTNKSILSFHPELLKEIKVYSRLEGNWIIVCFIFYSTYTIIYELKELLALLFYRLSFSLLPNFPSIYLAFFWSVILSIYRFVNKLLVSCFICIDA